MSISARVQTHKLSTHAALCAAGFNQVSGNSPAIEAMTDFSRISAVTVSGGASIDEASARMISRGVRLLMVTGHDDLVLGLITARDLSGEKPMQLLQARGGRREELTVNDLMVRIGSIDTLYLTDVMNARVSDIFEALKELGRQHILVEDIDQASGQPRVRGIFSATQIGRQLGLPVLGYDLPRTFAEIGEALAH